MINNACGTSIWMVLAKGTSYNNRDDEDFNVMFLLK